MKRHFSPSQTSPSRGFTLIEMLAVIAIIATLMTVGAIGMKSLSAGKGTTAGIASVETLIEETRMNAISRNTRARLLIHVDYIEAPAKDSPNEGRDTAESQRYLRYMAIAYEQLDENNLGTGVWLVPSRGILLPEDTYFHPELSENGGNLLMETNIRLPGRKRTETRCYYYEFNAQGRLVSPAPQEEGASSTTRFIIVGGSIRGGDTEPLPQPNKRGVRDYSGFVIWPSGRTSTIRDIDAIDEN